MVNGGTLSTYIMRAHQNLTPPNNIYQHNHANSPSFLYLYGRMKTWSVRLVSIVFSGAGAGETKKRRQ